MEFHDISVGLVGWECSGITSTFILNTTRREGITMTEPAPNHMCVFVCDLQIVKSCLERSAPMPYSSRMMTGWRVIAGGNEEIVICAPCYEQFA